MTKPTIENRLADAEERAGLGDQSGLTSGEQEELQRLNESHEDIPEDDLRQMIVHYRGHEAALALDLAMRSIGGAL